MSEESLSALVIRLAWLESWAESGREESLKYSRLYLALIAALPRLLECAKIVGELARQDPVMFKNSYHLCLFCEETTDRVRLNNPANHPATCLWRRAKEISR